MSGSPRALALLVLIAATLPGAAARAEGPSLAVLSFSANGEVSPSIVGSMNELFVSELERTRTFSRIVGWSDILDSRDFQTIQRMLEGCTDDGCLPSIGGLLGVDMVARGRVARLGSQYQLDGKVFPVRAGSGGARHDSLHVSGEDDALPAGMKRLARRLAGLSEIEEHASWVSLEPLASVVPHVAAAFRQGGSQNPEVSYPDRAWAPEIGAQLGLSLTALGVAVDDLWAVLEPAASPSRESLAFGVCLGAKKLFDLPVISPGFGLAGGVRFRSLDLSGNTLHRNAGVPITGAGQYGFGGQVWAEARFRLAGDALGVSGRAGMRLFSSSDTWSSGGVPYVLGYEISETGFFASILASVRL